MKKIVFLVSTSLVFSVLAIAHQQDSTLIKNSKSSDKIIEQNKDKKYADSSGKYAPYGDPKNNNDKKSKDSKSKNKRGKVDSVNPKM